MQLSQIVSCLVGYKPVAVQLPAPSEDLLGTRITPPEQPDGADSALLCLCTGAELARLALDGGYSGSILVCEGGAAVLAAPPSLPERANVIVLTRPAPKAEVADLLSQQFVRERALYSGMQTLLRAQAEGRGIQRLIDAAYTVLKNPIFVSDLSNQYIAAVYDEDTFDPEGAFAGFILDDILFNFISSSGHRFISRNKLDNALQGRSEPLRIFHEVFGTEALFANLRIENISVGRIFMCAIEHPFTDTDVELFRFLISICERELRKEDRLFFDPYAQDSMCLVNLISVSYVDEVMASRCTMFFRLKPGCRYQLAASAPLRHRPGSAVPTLLMSHLHYAFPNLPLALHRQRLVIFFPIYADEAPDQNIAALQEFYASHRVKFGLSDVYSDLGRSPEEFERAAHTADLGSFFCPENCVFQHKDLVIYELLTSYQRSQKIISLVSPEIFAICQADREKGTEYLPTLSAYLRFGGRSQKICSELHIHKNTLLYRMEKLRSTFGLQLDDGDAQFRYYLSLIILKVVETQQHTPPPDALPPDGTPAAPS